MAFTWKVSAATWLLMVLGMSGRVEAAPWKHGQSLPVYHAATVFTSSPHPHASQHATGAPLANLRPCPHICLLLSPGQSDAEAIQQFEQKNHCSVGSATTPPPSSGQSGICSEQWRQDDRFLGASEGALRTKGYVPQYTRDKKNKKGEIIHKKGDVIGVSGVTISTGVDLGQQSKSGTRSILDKYVKDRGNPGKVDVGTLMKKLDPYFGLKKQAAVGALKKTPLTISKAEAQLLANAFGYDTETRAAAQFDKKNTKGMSFKKLPEQAQTVIVDFSYQYGLSDSRGAVRKTFWTYVYDGDWKKLAEWLKSGPDSYRSRRMREGRRLQAGIDGGALPVSGNPCAAAAVTKDSGRRGKTP